jgi:hypothetical protein
MSTKVIDKGTAMAVTNLNDLAAKNEVRRIPHAEFIKGQCTEKKCPHAKFYRSSPLRVGKFRMILARRQRANDDLEALYSSSCSA